VDAVADAAMFEAIRSTLRAGIACREVDANLNEPAFADEAVATFRALWATRRPGEGPDRRAVAVDQAGD
jgi:uncharacterized protein (UPF0261 family)